MDLTPVSSSNLAAVGFDPFTSVLVVQFRDGAAYEYFDVPAAIYTGLLRAVSKGRFFDSQIRDQFAYRQICVAN